MYRNNVGLGDKYKFGVEIEFTNINLAKLYSVLSKTDIPSVFSLKHKSKNLEFDKWILDIDPTITESDGERMVGGELSSRILTDDKKSWDELKKVCLLLKDLNGKISGNCGLHVNVDISELLDNQEFLKTLIKLFFVYENDINLFFMGDKFFVRDCKEESSCNFREKLIDVIDHEELLEKHRCFDNHYYRLNPLGKNCGLNFDKVLDSGLLEIRYGNGTLDHDIIQNFCNFVLKVINAIECGKIDESFLDAEIKKIKSDPLFSQKLDTFNEDVDGFLNLLRSISLNEEDYIDLSRQYIKVVESKK